MAIQVKCPNGHVLKVKDKYAGKSGLCPRCHARIDVPLDPNVEARQVDRVSRHYGAGLKEQVSEVHQDQRHLDDREHSGSSLLGSSLVRHKKPCPGCMELVPYWFASCPYCKTPLSGRAGP